MNQNLRQLVKRRITQFGIFVLMSVVTLNALATALIPDIQQVKITIGFKEGETLEKAFSRLSETSKVPFNYNHNELRKVSLKNLKFKNETLNLVLKSILTGTSFHYKEGDNCIVIYKVNEKQEDTFTANTNVKADQITIKGTVSGESGPIPGVIVKVKNQAATISTGADGTYTIKAEKGDVLTFSMLGYLTKEVTVDSETTINITLESSTKSLSEVVVVGYGTQKKINVTGSVVSVDAKDLADRPVTGVANALQGKMAGVTITTNNGQPGRDGGAIRVRGIGTGLGTSGASASPAVIIDGIPGSLGDLNPNDIETITVLKDAASSAIYGARGSNGVILVTTKKGKKGELQLRYDAYMGTQDVTRRPDFLPSWQQAELYNEARANEKLSARWTPNDIQLFKDGTDKSGAHPNTDWLSLLYSESGLQQNHNVSLNGGDEKSRYMFSMGVLDQNGNIKGSKYQKYNGLLNLSSQLNKKIGLTAGLGFLYAPFSEPVSTYATGFSQLIRQFNRMSNTVPARWENGAYGYVSDGSPLAWLESASFNKWQNYTVTGNVAADWAPIEGLHIKPSLGYRLGIGQRQQYVSDIQYYSGGAAGTPLNPTKFEGPNNLTNATDRTTYSLLQVVADYTKTFNQHNFKILAGASQEQSAFNTFSAYRQGFLNNSLTQINSAPALGQSTSGYANEWALQSVFGRINYNFNEKYLLEANIRFDGSSRFAPGNRWGMFPSVSGGWVLSKEDFFSGLSKTVNLLKLRGFWGRLGNQQIANNYAYFESIAGGQVYSFNQTLVTGVAPNAGANPLLQWEETESYGVGLDAAFLNDKFTFSADYFVRKTENPLMLAQTGAIYGFTAPYVNVDGGLSNKGIELSAGYKDEVGKLNYSLNGNFAYTENKVTKLTGGKVISGSTFYDVGMPFNSLYGYEALGIYQNAAEVAGSAVVNNRVAAGDIKYKDQNNDGKIDANDKVYLGTYFPKITYGLTASASYKSFEVSVFLQGAAAVKAMVGNLIGGVGPDVQKPTAVFTERWTPTNPSTTFPRLLYTYNQNSSEANPSSFWVKDASYLRVKNVMLAYNLPKTIINKIGLSNLKVYYSGQNLLTFTKFYNWIDPEIGSAGSIYSYPQVKVNTFGLNVIF